MGISIASRSFDSLSWIGLSRCASLRSSYHCRFLFPNRGHVIKRSIYARQCDVPPGQFIEHPRGYFHVDVTRVEIRNNRRSAGSTKRTFLPSFAAPFQTATSEDRPNLVNFNHTDATLRLVTAPSIPGSSDLEVHLFGTSFAFTFCLWCLCYIWTCSWNVIKWTSIGCLDSGLKVESMHRIGA